MFIRMHGMRLLKRSLVVLATSAVVITVLYVVSNGLHENQFNESARTRNVVATRAEDIPFMKGKKIAIIGDSLTFQDANGHKGVTAAFEAAGWSVGSVWFYAMPGKTINTPDSSDHTTVQNIAACRAQIGEPDVWVIALGTNDALQGIDATQVNLRIKAVLMALGPDARVAWVNTAGDPAKDSSSFDTVVNTAIASAMQERSHSLLIDWSAYISRDSQESYWRDAVHMTPSGYAFRNTFIADTSKKAVAL